jgi:hypothetical protein
MQKNSSVNTKDAPVEATTVLHQGVADIKKSVAAATGYSEKAIAGMRDMSAFNTDTLAAASQANHILVAGAQELFRQATDSGQAAFAATLADFRMLGSVKTLKDGLEVQANMVRTSFGWMTENLRLAQASLELVNKASVPLTARTLQAVEKLAAPVTD